MASPQSATIQPTTARELFGYGPPPTQTREKLLFVAMDFFYNRGIHAVGLDQILQEVGVTKTTFYNHFESKDDLVLETLRRRDELESQAWDREVTKRAGYDPKARILATFEVLDMWFTNPAFIGCQFINVAHEFPSPYDPVHKIAAEHATRTMDTFEMLAEAAGADDPAALAEELSVLISGAITCRLVNGNNQTAATARRAAALLLEKRTPPA